MALGGFLKIFSVERRVIFDQFKKFCYSIQGLSEGEDDFL